MTIDYALDLAADTVFNGKARGAIEGAHSALIDDRPNEAIAIALISIADSLASIEISLSEIAYPSDGKETK